ncbi:MAG: beta-ketoacyl synthase N-terminal-like domain-containing protein, partial [Pirellulales bacterium]
MLNEPLALVGMSCRLPGGDGLDEFWKLVAQGATAWGRLPEDRLSRDLYFAQQKGTVGKSYSELGGLVTHRPIDRSVCPLTSDHVENYDIAHQIFLEVASRACRDAGLDPFAMPKHSRTGVYVGHTGGSAAVGDYVYSTRIDEAAHLLHEVDVARELLGGDAVARLSEDVTASVRRRYAGRKAGRPIALSALDAARLVREALQLEGPYLVVDAACASSLQALAIAARALNAGSIDQAIVGGASYCKSDSLVLFSAAQSVSNTGSCPFGKNADGLVTAEGYVALVLKTLSKAVEDGDRIRAVIRGIGVASDGKGKSLWAPRQEGQTLAVQRAYPKKEDLSNLDYIEAHATSTQVGDATELGALAGLLSQHIPPDKKVPIGSVKANVGHTLETAGLASLVKVVLAMEHNLIPPGTTADEFNDEFNWEDGPFRVPKSTETWEPRKDGRPRLAAVNAFGIGGLNVHLAIAEHVESVKAVRPAGGRNQLVRDEPIAIVGSGCVLPGALSVSEFEKMLAEGRSAIQAVLPERWSLERAINQTGPKSWHTTAGLGGFVQGFTYDWRRHKVPPKQIAAANPLQFMLLEAADAALADAGLKNETWDRTRVSVVVGTMFGGDFSHDLQIGLRLPETAVILTDLLHRHGLSDSQIVEVLSAYEKKVLERFPALVDETGSFTSSTLASRLTKSFNLMGGALALDAGDCSSTTAIAAAVDMLRDGSSDAVLCAAGQRYLDLVAYEMLSLRGSLASRPRTALDLDGEGRIPGEGAVVLVMKRLSDAQAAGDTIHGVIRDVSVSAGEHPEATAARVMDDVSESTQLPHEAVVTSEYSGLAYPERDKEVLKSLAVQTESESVHPVSSLDGQIGHLGAAAGAAGVLKLMNAVRSGSLPAAASIQEDRTLLDRLHVSSKPYPLSVVSASGYRAGSLTEVNDDLIGHLVLDNGLPLSKQGKHSASMSPATQNTVQDHVNNGRIAALFPGQGSQYTGMFQGLANEIPEGQVALAELDELARLCQAPTLAEVAWKSPNKMGSGVWETQWAMYLGDLFAWKILKAMGFHPDCIASHSFGEFPALTAAGCWSEKIGFKATKARAEAVEQYGPADGAMLSILADAEFVQAAIKPFDSIVWRCAENAPEQTVVGGTSRAIDAVELLLEPTRTRAKRLAVPSPFHTPLLAKAAAELSQTLESLPITESQFPILSSTTLNVLSTPATVRTSLVRQMTETVRWVQVVKQLYQQGVRTFVEVGPGAVLSGLVRRILADCRDITIVQFDQRGRTSAEQVARLQDALGLSVGFVSAGVSAQHGTDSESVGDISRFDATARRRERNRDAAAEKTKKQALKPVAKAEVPPSPNGNHASRFDYVASARHSSQRQGALTQSGFSKPRGAGASIVDVPSALSQPHSPNDVPANAKAGLLEVESFLIDFVIEQTGYPREIVELDADLEADLGIDSIRKA